MYVNTEDAHLRKLALQEEFARFEKRRLHMLYRETLADYRSGGSDWIQNFTRKTLSNIWEEYRTR